VLLGGFGQAVNGYIMRQGLRKTVKNFAYRDEFIPQGSIAKLQSEYGVDCVELEKFLLGIL
jgi:deoxyxylulose-5-phosphate synthase